MKTSNQVDKLLLSIHVIVGLLLWCPVVPTEAQETKGGLELSSFSSAGPSGFSKFRETISSIQRKQQQLLPQVQENYINQNSITQTTNQLVQPQIIEQSNEQQTSFRQQQQQISTNLIQEQQQSTSFSSDAEPSIYGSVKGTPGIDFPALTSIPNTKFSCDSVPFSPGMYADESTGCQVYHLCYHGRKESFLCGIGTVFNQAILNCDFWHSVECSKSSQFYHLNADFGKSSPEPSQLQSISKQTVINSNRQIVVPQLQQQITKFSSEQQTSQIVRPPPPTIIQSNRVESSYSSFGDKISPPKSTFISSINQNSFQSSSGNGKTSLPKEVFSSFRSSSSRQQQQGLLSPGRRVAIQNQLTGTAQQQLASEISARIEPMSNTTQNAAQNSLPVGSSLMVVNSVEENKISQQPVRPPTKTSAAGKYLSSVGAKSLQFANQLGGEKSVKQFQSKGESQDVWKPYFKSKSASGSSKTNSGNRDIDSSSGATSGATTTTTTQAPVEVAPTNQPPNQEPAFSSNSESQPSTSSPEPAESGDELPKVPKSSPPPVESTLATTTSPPSTSGNDQPESAIEADVGSPLTTTSSPGASEESAGTSEAPPSPTTTTTGSTDTSSETSTTTSNTSDENGESTPPTSEAGETSGGEGSRSKRKKKKKRKANLAASSVEYASG